MHWLPKYMARMNLFPKSPLPAHQIPSPIMKKGLHLLF